MTFSRRDIIRANLRFFLHRLFNDTINPRYNEQNLAVCNCEYLQMLKHQEGFVIRELFKIKNLSSRINVE
jgi:hypothetical protein